MPERASSTGLFLSGLQPTPEPARFFAPAFLDDVAGRALRPRFGQGGLHHVTVQSPLAPGFAASIASALEDARFVRHPYGPYPLHVARRTEQRESALTEFMSWLSTPDSIGFHTGAAGAPLVAGALPPLRLFDKVQVQASRMLLGESFPLHVDTDQLGIAAVYNLTRSLDQQGADGGVLEFEGVGRSVVVPPRFNTLTLFAATDVPHRVTEIRSTGGARYSITSFFLLRPTDFSQPEHPGAR
jgi:hypothetical protein